MKASNYQSTLDQLKGKRDTLDEELSRYTRIQETSERNEQEWELAKALIVDVGLKTQQQLQYQISNLTTLAMEAVFDDPYEVEITFVPRRGKTECDIFFKRNGKYRDPLESSGLGAADIASFALRVAALSMSKNKLRKVLLFDEPFQHLKGAIPNKRAIQMIKEISDRLKIQIITVSDERTPLSEIEKGADKIFHVERLKGISKVN